MVWHGPDRFFRREPGQRPARHDEIPARGQELGTKVVLVNPYFEPGMKRYWVPSTLGSALFGTDIADYWFAVSQGGDIAFLYGVLKVLVTNGWVDEDFVSNHTGGFDELRSRISHLTFTELEAQSGVDRAAMEEFAGLIHAPGPPCWFGAWASRNTRWR